MSRPGAPVSCGRQDQLAPRHMHPYKQRPGRPTKPAVHVTYPPGIIAKNGFGCAIFAAGEKEKQPGEPQGGVPVGDPSKTKQKMFITV